MYLQYRKRLGFPCLLKSIVWAENSFYMQYDNKYCHIKEQIWEMRWSNSYLSVLSVASDLNISESPHV